MKKLFFILALITLPVLTFGQNASKATILENEIITIKAVSIQESKSNTIASTFSKTDVNNLSYKKSNDLISIKAYRKSLQIRTKEVKTC